MIFVSTNVFHNRIINENTDKAEMLTKTLAGVIDGDSIDRYLDTLQKDEEYERTLELMRVMQQKPEVLYLYVVRIIDGYMHFVFDADENDDTRMELGEYEEWFGEEASVSYEEFNALVENNESLHDVSNSEWGWLLTVFEPIFRSDGSVSAFVCIDISMDRVMQERQNLIGLLVFIILIFFIITITLSIVTIQGWIFKPLKAILDNVTQFRAVMISSGELPELTLEQEISNGNELEVLRDVLTVMEEHIAESFDEKKRALNIHKTVLDTFFDTIPDLIYIKDLELRFTHVNNAMLENYQLKLEDIIGKNENEIWEPGVLDKDYDAINRSVIAEGGLVRKEETIRHADGSYSLYETIRMPIIIDGAITNVMGMARDITKRKEMETFLEDSYNYAIKLAGALSSITQSPDYSTGDLKTASSLIAKVACHAIGSSRVGIWSIDKDASTLKCIAGYDLSTRTFTSHGEMDMSDCIEYKDLLNNERLIITNETRIPNPLSPIFEKYYGQELCATLDAPIRVGNRLAGVVCIEQDSTVAYPERRAWTLEEQSFVSSLADFAALSIEGNERRALSHRTELLMNSLPGMVFQSENNPPDNTLHFLSEGCFALTGYTRDEIMGVNPGDKPINYFDIVYPDDAPALKKLMDETLFVGMPLETTYRIITKYGAVKWIWDRSHVTDYDDDGRPRTFEGFYTDITEQRRLEAAEAASHAKSEFLSNMSHEMRTPLNAIIGMTAIGKKTDDIEGKTHALNKIGDASSHLLGMVNDILDMAKIEANRLELLSTEFHFEHMIDKVLTMIHFRADEKQQTLTVNIDKNIPRFVLGDDQRLSQVLINILWNAVKFTQVGGNIHMDILLAKKKVASCELRIEISDNGIGISPAQQAKLFGVFEQADSKAGRAYGGTGLGLAIAKRIVEMMDGKIWVDSELGKGASFIFTVFVGIVSDKTSQESSNGAAATGITEIKNGEFAGKHLLVAEDVEINREILLALLEDTGIKIDCAENGREAVDMVSADIEKYDMILMDLQMPHMSGLEATRFIRTLPPRKKAKIPIIAMTANVFKEDIDACLAAGMDDHLGKPLDIDKVMEKLSKHLRKEGKQ